MSEAEKTERAMMRLEAEADRWLADAPQFRTSVDLVTEATKRMVGMTPEAAAPFIKRQRDNVDAMIRQAYLEGFYNGWTRRADIEAATK